VIRSIGWAESLKPRNGVTAIVAPIIVFAVLGVVSISFPQLLGNGKDAVQIAYDDRFPLSLLLALPLLKLLATCGCLGSGARGGLFTPMMTIGALLGGLMGHAWEGIWPGASMGSCSVIGSCAFLAATTQGPVSALVLVLELTRHVDATMVPMLLAVAGTMMVTRQFESRSVYSMRFHPKHRQPSALPAHFDRLMSRQFSAISAAAGLGLVARCLLSARFKSPLYVLDHEVRLLGTIDAKSFESAQLGAMPIESAKASDIAVPALPLSSEMGEEELLKRLAQENIGELPVVDDRTGRMIGVIVIGKAPNRPNGLAAN
jgi:hypothetical protein